MGVALVVTEWVIHALSSLIGYVLMVLPTFNEPSWAYDGTIDGGIQEINGFLTGMGAWLPVDALATAMTLMIGAVAVAVGAKIVRIVASFVTLGGGSAG